jgi:signal transduction histidine kinase
MKIKTKLSLQFTVIAAGILLFFSLLVYYFSYTSQVGKFRENLYERARNNAILLINVSEVDSSLLKKIHQSTVSLEKEEIAMTDSAFNPVYTNNVNYLSNKAMRAYANKTGVSFFSISEKDGVFFRHYFRNRSFNVFELAFDRSRHENLTELREILLWSILFSIWLSVATAYFFSNRAIKPISDIIKSVKGINSEKLGSRLDEGNGKDEIASLAITFNDMLKNLEIAFRNQEDFVSNASHELRTPLSVMIAEGDYFLTHDIGKEEYAKYVESLIGDLKKINSMLTSLLELAQVNKDVNIMFSRVRIDEALFNSIRQVKINFPERKIIPRIRYPESDEDLMVKGNSGLLEIAFRNIIDNSCKFSDGDIDVEFSFTAQNVTIIISDKGIGIPARELENIFQPFSRASNAKYIGGFGIGLSLVTKIMELHGVVQEVESTENQGTRFKFTFRKAEKDEGL